VDEVVIEEDEEALEVEVAVIEEDEADLVVEVSCLDKSCDNTLLVKHGC